MVGWLRDGCLEHRNMVGGGHRNGTARTPHDREGPLVSSEPWSANGQTGWTPSPACKWRLPRPPDRATGPRDRVPTAALVLCPAA